jgi:hypothetical protein
VLPTIVATVWMCGWVRQQDDRIARDRWAFPPLEAARRATDAASAPTPLKPVPVHTFFAAASEEGAAGEP